MGAQRRSLTFILINICLSAVVTGTMLLIYDHNYRQDCLTNLAISTPVGTFSPIPGAVNILGVIGPSSLENEVVLVQNDGSLSLSLTGWYIQNGQDEIYTFPQLTIYPGGLVKVHTMDGMNSATDLFLGRSTPVWASGRLVVLYDSLQVARAIYRIP